MGTATVHAYAGPADLRAMQDCTQRVWSFASRWHVGDLAWDRNQHTGREPEWPTALWRAPDGTVRGWGWLALPDDLGLVVDPAYGELVDEVVDWAEHVATAPPRTTVLDGEDHLTAALRRRGYRPVAGPFSEYLRRDLADLPDVSLPPGFTGRSVTCDDVAQRVAVHRAAFHPSRVTVESYRNVMAAWPYRGDLDQVVVAPDGTFAAYCLGWHDARHQVGELEPVGTHPNYRRRGLARAACLAAMRALRAAGAHTAIVYPPGDAAHPVPGLLYRSLGFEPYARTLTFARPA